MVILFGLWTIIGPELMPHGQHHHESSMTPAAVNHEQMNHEHMDHGSMHH
jgi:hypothetical protein